MTVAELRRAMDGLPDDMPVRPCGTTVGDQLRVTVSRYHFSVGSDLALRIAWAGVPVEDDPKGSGYHPTAESVLHVDTLR